MGWDLTLNPKAKLIHYSVYRFIFQTVKDIYMESSDAYILSVIGN